MVQREEVKVEAHSAEGQVSGRAQSAFCKRRWPPDAIGQHASIASYVRAWNVLALSHAAPMGQSRHASDDSAGLKKPGLQTQSATLCA